MQATGNTSTKRSPDDPVDGLHPVLPVTLRTGHEQEPLGAGWHLLPLPGTTCKTGRRRLTPGTLCRHGDLPSLTPVIILFLAMKGISLQTSATALLWVLLLQPILSSLITVMGTFGRFLL